MSDTPDPSLTHIRASVEGKDKTNISLCGIPSPSSSYSYPHARLMYLGRYNKSTVQMCPTCEKKLKALVDDPDSDPNDV